MSKPKIRFKRFTDDWEQRKLGELGEILTGSTPSTSNSAYYSEDGIPWVTPTDINELTISDTPRKLSEEGAKVGRVVPANTILCTCIASIGKNALLTVKGSFNQQINSLTPSAGNDAYFLLTESKLWSNKMKRMAASGTMQIVNKTEFSELDTLVPSTDEQKKIGSYFRNLDHLITLHQRKYNKLVNIKKSMIEKMFPQNGACVPEIRFKGFTDDWEQRKLSDIVDVLDGDRGKNYPTSDDFDISGHTLFLNASNVTNDGFLFQDNQFITEEKSNSMGNGKLEDDDIVVTSRGSLGHIAWYNADISSFVPYARINSGMLILRNKKEVETEYLCHFMKSSKGQSQISFISFGSAQPQLTKKGVEDLEVILPKRRDEQVQLGYYFSNLDHLITLHQRKIEKLKNIKKSCLEKMFV